MTDIVAAAEALRLAAREYNVDGQRPSGEKRVKKSELRVFASALKTWADRVPRFTTDRKLPYYDTGGVLAELDIDLVIQAATLVDFGATIDAEIAAAVAGIITGISEDAPFNERFADAATLLADLAYPDGAYAIDMTALVIYRKTGASGTGSWVVHSNILDAFPGTASDADITAVNARVDDTETDIAAMQLQLNRLNTAVPPIAPVWLLVPDVIVDETFTGTVRDLAAYVVDPDSPPENLTFTAPGGLPAGFGIVGRNLVKTSTSGVVARASYALTVTDESGNVVTGGTVVIQAYTEGVPPSLPPVWATFPTLTTPFGSAYTFNFAPYLSDADTALADITVSLAAPVTGITVNSAAKTVTFANTMTVGAHAFTLVADDGDNDPVTVALSVTISSATAPVWGYPPPRAGFQFGPGIVIDLNSFLTDAATPLSELGASLVLAGAPSLTTNGGSNDLVVSVPSLVAGGFTITATVTNRAGLSASRSFDVTFTAAPPPGPEGPGGGLPRIEF